VFVNAKVLNLVVSCMSCFLGATMLLFLRFSRLCSGELINGQCMLIRVNYGSVLWLKLLME